MIVHDPVFSGPNWVRCTDGPATSGTGFVRNEPPMRVALTVYDATVGFATVPELAIATAMSFDRVIRPIEHASALLENCDCAASIRCRGARPGKVIAGQTAAGTVVVVTPGTVVVAALVPGPAPVVKSHDVSDSMLKVPPHATAHWNAFESIITK